MPLTIDDFQIVPRGSAYPHVGPVGTVGDDLVKVRFYQAGNKRGVVAAESVADHRAIQDVANHVGVIVEYARAADPEQWLQVRPTVRTV